MNLKLQFDFIKEYEFYHLQDNIEIYETSLKDITCIVYDIYKEYEQLFIGCNSFKKDMDINDYFFEQKINNTSIIGDWFDLANKAIESIWKIACKCFLECYNDYLKDHNV